MWIYFIFAVCQWLPTNHRLFYGDTSPFRRDRCQLCSMGSKEDIHHTMFLCPALDTPRQQLHNAVQGALEKWKLPFSNLQVDLKGKTIAYFRKISEMFETKVPKDRLSILANDFWKVNSQKPNVPRAIFANVLGKAINESQSAVSLSESLVTILVEHFRLNVEALSSCLIHSRLLYEWCSEREEDSLFGSLENFRSTSLDGKNTLFVYLHPPGNEDKYLYVNTNKIQELVLPSFQQGFY